MERFLNKTLFVLLSIFPVGLFVIKGWASAILFLSSLIATILISKVFNNKSKNGKIERTEDLEKCPYPIIGSKWPAVIMITLAFPVFAVFITQQIRGVQFLPDYDSPVRFLLALPVFYVALKNKFNPIKYWQVAISVSILITFLTLPWIPKYYGVNAAMNDSRLGTYFIDPLTFGRLSLTLGVLLLFTINIYNKEKWYSISFKLTCSAIAVYLSLKSGSRTGWVALPFVLVLLVWIHGPKNKFKAMLVALLVSVVASTALYSLSPTVHSRVNNAISDLNNYEMNNVNTETSLGERISFARMGWYYFKINPITGWGHDGFKAHYDDPEISVFADTNTRHHPAEGGLFHNEMTTNMVAFGIFGVVYTCLLFLAPFVLFVSAWRKGLNCKVCAFGIAYVVCEISSSLSTEVFALKFTASFYAIVIACLCANVLSAERCQPDPDRELGA